MDSSVLLNQFLLGAAVMACAAIGVFFLGFWRKTHDRLFLIFALAFWLLAANWTTLAFIRSDETRGWLYLLRLLAFILILVGIVDKNRKVGSSR